MSAHQQQRPPHLRPGHRSRAAGPAVALRQAGAALLAAAALACPQAHAQMPDSSDAPVIEAFSRDRTRFVRVVPARSADPGRPAAAQFYRQAEDQSYRLVAQAPLANTAAPVLAFVSDHGYLALLDNWYDMGRGVLLALYDPEGRPVRAYEAADLFSPDEVASLPRRVSSSLRWRQGASFVRPDQATLRVSVDSNAHFVFGMETGRFRYCELRYDMQPYCRDAGWPRHWLPESQLPVTR
jgi:hypothetical protein